MGDIPVMYYVKPARQPTTTAQSEELEKICEQVIHQNKDRMEHPERYMPTQVPLSKVLGYHHS